MGYTPRTLELIAEMVRELAKLSEGAHTDGGWVVNQHAYMGMHLVHPAPISTWRKRMMAALELGLIERREANPGHVDQRVVYWRATEVGQKICRNATDTGIHAALHNHPDQIHIPTGTSNPEE